LFIWALFCVHGCGDPVQNKATNIILPVPVAPPDGSSNIPINPTFRWTGTADKLEIDYTPSFSPPEFSATVSGNQYNMPPDTLAHNQWYYWRVGVTSGSTTYWSKSVFAFKTE
ncbi:MAG TPA: hypothetical protein VGK25_02090, partial [Ignavibacteria bacterium]